MPDRYDVDQEMDITSDNIGDFLLNVLTRGLYNQPDLILREYIQNSHDAICGWRDMPVTGRIDIRVDWPNIHVFDNGPGMNNSELYAAMKNVGISNKVISESTGFMGIGKLAGLSMAATVEIHSSKYGDPYRNWVRFDAGRMLTSIMQRRKSNQHHALVDTLNKHIKMNPVPLEEDAEKHYTVVHLLDIQEEYAAKIQDLIAFERSIALIAPVKQSPLFNHADEVDQMLSRNIQEEHRPIDVFINGNQIYRPYVEGLDKPIEIEVEDDEGKLLAYGWACLNTSSERNKRQIPEEDLRGIAFVKRGITIGSRRLPEDMGLYTSSSDVIYFRWYTGELYIVDPEIIVSADRTRIRQSETTITFVEKATKQFKRLARKAGTYSAQDNASTTIKKTTEIVDEVEVQINEGKLTNDRLPSIISKLGKAQSEVEKRRRHLKGQDSISTVEKLEDKIERILTDIVKIEENEERSENIEEDLVIVELGQIEPSQGTDDESNSEEYLSKPEIDFNIIDITEKLDFTPRETVIYRIIVNALAENFGGKDKDEFVSLLMKVEDALLKSLGDQEEDDN